MAAIKSFTDLNQAKVLSKILPLESADMCYLKREINNTFIETPIIKPIGGVEKSLCCWSIAALLEQLPYEVVDDDGNSSYLQINKEDDVYQLVYEDPCWEFKSIETDKYEHFVDACYELILKLNELNLL